MQLSELQLNANDNMNKYKLIRTDLKEREGTLKQEILDSEKVVELVDSIQRKEKQVELSMEHIKCAENDPHAVNEALKHAKTVIVLIEEIIEIIIIVEEILVIITKRCQKYPTILQVIESKSTLIFTSKTKVTTIKSQVKEEQKRMLDMQQKSKTLNQQIQLTSDWLPSVESRIIKFTPVSANYDILKSQEEEINVSVIFYKIYVGIHINYYIKTSISIKLLSQIILSFPCAYVGADVRAACAHHARVCKNMITFMRGKKHTMFLFWLFIQDNKL